MTIRISRRAVGLGLMAAPAVASAQAPAASWKVPSDAEIKAILQRRIDVENRGVGIVVGVVDASGRRFVSHGTFKRGEARPVGRDTLYEIGSITKVFTSLLLSEAVRRGEVALDDPVQKYLPTPVRMPERGGKQITLVDLATHTSALPRMPSNFTPKDPLNPYADYTVEQLYALLPTIILNRDIGSQYEYSNLGAGLLGHVLAQRAAVDWETLCRQRITGPLGMRDTAVVLPSALQTRLAAGHNQTLEPTSNWDIPTLIGAGGLRSTADDMLTLLAAELSLKASPLRAAMDAQLAVRRPAQGGEVALGWHIRHEPNQIIWHNGGTGGYRTFAGFNPLSRVGVTVLTNSSVAPGGDDIGFRLLLGAPLQTLPPLKLRQAISLPEARLEGLVGRYQLIPQITVTVTREGPRLMAQLTGQQAAEIFPETTDDFFYKTVDAQITFTRGGDGKATGIVLHQNGRHMTAPRIP